ncbi:MAG: TIGR03088 family PEP-CTERM/XrtA system glycosyltransferase [Candidatus Competibacteraceae bacterium]|nr:TIGR03088 family PEP-CTERM/XrtA system glycosyltransferase [Candidatus Competibacteraceae bacterium]MCP5124382.1 TIGR03088 family PEP-CTERM/XrtA system glycosyltransferase [Gammaproteobacteria bacterium]HRX69992.1 TIGR03088 family PEP-CTERM/XrtA system glycosyltransferase [Candidatus Competibacteraceae bacterium]
MADNPLPLVAHIIFRLDYGGLENGLVNLINRIPPERYRHAIICLTDYNPEFRRRIQQPDVAVFALHKREGHDLGLYRRCWSLLRRLRPAIAHTRNLAALEMQLPAWLAGVRARVHGEHGWDRDPALMHPRHHRLRRWLRPLVSHYIALSGEIASYLETRVGVTPEQVSRIINGVDSVRFHPGADRSLLPAGFTLPETSVIGTVGRLEKVKDQLNLAQAFIQLAQKVPNARQRLRLVIIGEGSLRVGIESLLNEAGLRDLAWLPGARDDVSEMLRSFDLFVLPSQAEGISNTILEAMACGLPVVATEVGGNAELVVAGKTGRLIPASDPEALALAIREYMDDPGRMLAHGAAGRQRIEERFSMETMVDAYLKVYDNVLKTPLSP